MGTYLNPGNRSFRETLKGRFYVDKTKLAVFMNERIGTPDKFACVSRPRRFGKSVDADMLVAYWSRGAESRELFAGLVVEGDSTFEGHLNAHDVIKLDMTHLRSYSSSLDELPTTIAEELIPELRAAWPNAIPEHETNLFKAFELAYEEKGSGFVFVIDEWDFIFREAKRASGAQERYLDFLRDLLKGRLYADACYMTGILPIKKYGVHSALNMFTEYSMVDPDVLSPLTGFNADDVELLCERFGKDYEEVSRWYDGYLLGPERVHVFNPRSVAGAMSSLTCRSFWTTTETYEALQAYIDLDFDGIATDIVSLLDGVCVPANVENFENDMTTFHDKDDVYALLVHLGYLGYDQIERGVFIPNEEIRREFVRSLRHGSHDELARLVQDSRKLIRYTIEGDCDYVADAVRRAHDSAAGPRYYNDEQALRAAVKLAYIAAIDEYLRIDELPGGRGYADLAFIPRPGSAQPPMIVELKWDRPADAAIAQIRCRNYPAAISGLTGECILVGITYRADTDEHECVIERFNL